MRRPRLWLWHALALGLLAPLCLTLVLWAGLLALPPGPASPIRLFLLLVLGPIVEEYVLRGHLQPWLQMRWQRWCAQPSQLNQPGLSGKAQAAVAAVIMSSGVFTGLHLLAAPHWATAWVFVPSLAFGYARVVSGHWLPSAALHSWFNLVWLAAVALRGT